MNSSPSPLVHVLFEGKEPSTHQIRIDVAQQEGGSQVELIVSALRVAFHTASESLFVSDVHLGKAAAFRSLGVPVPAGTTQANLDRLSKAVALFKPKHLFILGDLIHAPESHSADLTEAFVAWRDHHKDLQITLIRGNHDDRAGDPPASWQIELHDEPYVLGGLALCHYPQSVPGKFVLAGHEHPVFYVTGKGRARVRLPCFYQQSDRLIFPSFGEFTGGFVIKPMAGEVVYPLVG